MSVNLSPLAGAGAQFFTDSGTPLTGGLLYTYAAGTTSIYKGGIGAPGAVGIPSRIYGGLDDRYDLQCAVYNQGAGEKKQCTAATITLPDGSSMSPCRVCWTHPHLTVNFMAH